MSKAHESLLAAGARLCLHYWERTVGSLVEGPQVPLCSWLLLLLLLPQRVCPRRPALPPAAPTPPCKSSSSVTASSDRTRAYFLSATPPPNPLCLHNKRRPNAIMQNRAGKSSCSHLFPVDLKSALLEFDPYHGAGGVYAKPSLSCWQKAT